MYLCIYVAEINMHHEKIGQEENNAYNIRYRYIRTKQRGENETSDTDYKGEGRLPRKGERKVKLARQERLKTEDHGETRRGINNRLYIAKLFVSLTGQDQPQKAK